MGFFCNLRLWVILVTWVNDIWVTQVKGILVTWVNDIWVTWGLGYLGNFGHGYFVKWAVLTHLLIYVRDNMTPRYVVH
jgi:hypothetical protein